MFRELNDYNFFNKKVFVRCDFNVPIYKGKVFDSWKIKRALKTIEFLKESQAKIILASHLSKESWRKPTLKPVIQVLKNLLPQTKIYFAKSCIGSKAEKIIRKMKNGEIVLLENLRLEKGEEQNEEGFSKELARLAEIYVGEAFAVCHREHASIVTLPRLLPRFIGFECEQEVNVLSALVENPERPLVVLIGGAKAASKIAMVNKFLQVADYLLFGGKTANTLLTVKGICAVKKFLPSAQEYDVFQKINLTDVKIHLPLDVITALNENGDGLRQAGPAQVRNDEEIYDIGPSTIEKFTQIIQTAKTIFWSGDMGVVEKKEFQAGTLAIARAIVANNSALKIAGGGDTLAFIRANGLEQGFSYLSAGGGAMLNFIAQGTLPGIEALKI